VHTYAQDRLGSITALVTTSGTLASSYTYDPWGQALAATGTAYNPYRFTGTYLDDVTGLYMMGARYYQPSTGRFTQLDPLPESILDINRYAYAGCNPTNFVDRTGLASEYVDACLQDAFIGGVGGIVVGAIGGGIAGLIGGPLAPVTVPGGAVFGAASVGWTGLIGGCAEGIARQYITQER
jgi:RHS repeat-associated protein